MGDVTEQAKDFGRDAHESDWLDHAVRAGLVAYGVVHLLIAWLALQLAFGESQGSASSTGALQELAQQPFGGVLTWLVAIGMFLLVLWRLLEAALGHRDEEGGKRLRKRLTSLGKAVVYATIGYSALQVATSDSSGGKGGGGGGKGGGGSQGSSGGSDSFTARVMELPAGQWLVGLIGLAIIGYGANLVRRGWTDKFAEHLDARGKSGDVGTAYLWFGRIGYVSKGVAIGIVGGLFCYAALTHDAKKSGGLDQALHEVLQQPFGPILLGVIAAGIGCYGLFCFARARHLSR